MNNEPTKPPACALMDAVLPPLLRSLCRQPNDLEYTSRHGKASSTILVRPSDDDFGFIMGSHAKTFRSFKTICAAIGAKHRHQFFLEKLLGGRSRDDGKTMFQPVPLDPGFGVTHLHQLLVQTVRAFADLAQFTQEKDGMSYRILVTADPPEGVNELEIESALTTIFNGAAKLRGGDLRIVFRSFATSGAVPDAEAGADAQPETAAGRFTGEV